MTSCCSTDRGRPAFQGIVQATPASLPIAVIGGGPVGLAAAAHLLERGLEPIVFEVAPSVAAAPRAWGHVRMFSPWRYNIDKAARALLERNGWAAPDPEMFPTGRDLAERYLAPLASLMALAARVRLGSRVTAVTKAGLGKVRTAGRDEAPFELHFENADGHEGRLLARAVIDASGTWGNHGSAGAGGLPAIGERAASDRIRYGMPDVFGADRARYAGRRVMVLGSGDSALGILIDLARLADQAPGTTIVWAARNRDLTRAFGGGAADQLPARGKLGMRVRALAERGVLDVVKPFAVGEIGHTPDGALLVTGLDSIGTRTVEVDEMVVATGLRPDLSLLREVRLDLDPALDCPRALAPLIDPNVHSCGTVRPHGAAELQQPESGLFIVGMKSYGRAPTFLLATGYEQVRSIAAFLAGDIEASRRVELDLPQTGVCSSNLVPEVSDMCCGGAAPAETGACCIQDVAAKSAGFAGCRCSSSAETTDIKEAETTE
jgi:thioredoxin reductase